MSSNGFAASEPDPVFAFASASSRSRTRASSLRQLVLQHEGGAERTKLRAKVIKDGGIRRDVAFYRSDEAQLRFQQFRDEPIERAVREHILHRHALGLTKAVSAVLGLSMVGGHPVEVLKDDVGAGRKGQADAAGYQVAHRDQAAVIRLESVDGREPLRSPRSTLRDRRAGFLGAS